MMSYILLLFLMVYQYFPFWALGQIGEKQCYSKILYMMCWVLSVSLISAMNCFICGKSHNMWNNVSTKREQKVIKLFSDLPIVCKNFSVGMIVEMTRNINIRRYVFFCYWSYVFHSAWQLEQYANRGSFFLPCINMIRYGINGYIIFDL